MSTISKKNGHNPTVPFLVMLFYRTGAFPRPEEFASQILPPHIPVYTWTSCTLTQLALELTASKSSVLPSPLIGTRLAFQLVCPDLRGASAINTAQPRFAVKDLGSIVIGEGGPGAESSDNGNIDGPLRYEVGSHKTLSDARFVVGDYISCAILPPLVDGSVAPAFGAKITPISSGREGRGGFRGGFVRREDNFGRNNSRQARGNRMDEGFPIGDWRRGEKLPDGPAGRPRGRGRW